MKATIVLCEGKHDAAFLYRILRVLGFKDDAKRKIADMPFPLGSYFKQQFTEHDYGAFNLEEARPPFPQRILRKDDLLVLLYGMGGNSHHDKTRKVIGDYCDYIGNIKLFPNSPNQEHIESVSFLFFTDADDKGIEHQVGVLRAEYGGVLTNLESLEHNHIVQKGDYLVGCYVFSDEQGIGKLEDLILPLFRQGHEELFDDIDRFLSDHDAKIDSDARKHLLKMEIGIAGQLQKPGSTNEVIIRHSKYITPAKLNSDRACCDIMQFLEKLFENLQNKQAVLL